jgi:hypothetical protein
VGYDGQLEVLQGLPQVPVGRRPGGVVDTGLQRLLGDRDRSRRVAATVALDELEQGTTLDFGVGEADDLTPTRVA